MLNIYVTQLFYQRRKEEFLLALTGEADREWALPGQWQLCLRPLPRNNVCEVMLPTVSKEEPAVCAHWCAPGMAGQGTSASTLVGL